MSLFSGLGCAGPSAHTDLLSATPDNLTSQRSLIEEIKRRGRACVISKNYPDADTLYGKGIDVLSSMLKVGGGDGVEDETSKKDMAVLYSNRSLVRMQMGKIAEALEDADRAINCDPTYVKAHWRRGQASNACGNTEEALAAFERAVELEPNNKALRKEVQNAKARKEREEKLLAEKASDDYVDPAAEGSSENNDVVTTDVRKETNAAKKEEKKQQAATSKAVTETDGSLFTKSDHVRGYKIRSDGKKTSYFDREISDDAKKLIGDIAPKKLDANNTPSTDTNDFAPKPIAAAEGKSAWNTAGTWEERDVTPWATETLTAALLTAEYVLPDGSPSPGARAVVSNVSKLEGHASYATVRGTKKYIYEFAFTIKWALTLGGDDDAQQQTCRGEMTFPDVDGTVELGEGYDIVNYHVDGSSPAGTGPLLDRFVRDGGLREAVHGAIDDWVKLFRATY
eukprot:CAMPEP_0181112564 /NCGR_PEP_ID=MMETSP1071-20121207/19882_1 /TAXON_ID=35127 /ORGANISM="Thalassiosira sp., Strain NH16" /LENGTH=453 /DNA_ID=CAMNT_0023196545 /DNA_START=45 /DNA_END=1406 /DNA_ORIENTATION=-